MSNRDVVEVFGTEVPKWKVRQVFTLKMQGVKDRDIAALTYLTMAQVQKILRDKK